MRWLSFIQQTFGATAAAAAGGAATAATANPLLGAAAGAAAKKSTEQLFAEFLPAQQQALETLLERTRGLELLLGGIRSDIQTLLDAPWKAALLHIADATKHPAKAQDELQTARNLLYEAWSSAASSAKRALIAQQVSVVYALLGEAEDSRDWLFRSYPEASNAVGEAIASVVESLDGLPRVKASVKRNSIAATVPADALAISRGWLDRKEVFCVRAEPLATALTGLAEARLDLTRLRASCALVGMPEPWPPSEWAPEALFEPVQRPPWLLGADGSQVSVGNAPGSLCFITGSDKGPMGAALLLTQLVPWSFKLEDVPASVAASQVFVSGSSAELGRWRQNQAIPLKYGIGAWWAQLDVLHDDRPEPVEYKYFRVQEPAGSAVWEDGPNRILPPARANAGSPLREVEDSWQA